MPSLRGVYGVLSFLLLWSATAFAQTTTPTIDLSVRKLVSNQKPAIGDVLTYTVIVANAPGSLSTATGVVVKDQLPADGITYLPASASTTHGTGSFDAVSGLWSVSAIAAGDSAVLVLKATVKDRGVWFSTAEVTAANQLDVDSDVNNQNLTEDDYDAVCFSVPVFYYSGDEFTVTIPSGYDQIVWYRDNIPVSNTSVAVSLAQVNADFSLTIKSPGVYRFVTYRNGCPASNCCDIEVIQGPFGSLGDFVFVDTNNNGKQDDGASGINGIKVYLYDQTGTVKLDSVLTAGGGRYLFDSLTDGKYKIKFVAPDSLLYTVKNGTATGTDYTNDSDAGIDGFTRVYMIDTSKPAADTARNNLTVDAGFTRKLTSIGDLVFYDNNGNGIQDGGSETGVPGVKVTLYQNSTVSGGTPTLVASTTTTASGSYLFPGLQPGSGYYVVFDTTGLKALGYMLTTPNATTNTALDSDAGANGATTPLSLSAGEFNSTIDAGLKPVFDVGITKSVVSAGPYLPGSSVTYQLTVKNNSPVPVYNVSVSDVLPAGLSFVSGAGFGASGANSVSAVVSPLLAGASTSLTLTAQVSSTFSGSSLANVAIVGRYTSTTDATGPPAIDSNPANNTATVSVPVGTIAPASLGDLVFYDNNGNGIQDGGSETGVAGVKVTLYQNPVGGGTPTLVASTTTTASGSYLFPGLQPGSGYYVVFDTTGLKALGYMLTSPTATTSTALDSDAGVGGVTAPVSLSAGEFNNTIDAGIKPLFDVGITKSVVSTGPYLPNNSITYQLTVKNNSPVPVYNVSVSDVLPAGLNFVSGTGFTTSGANSVSTVVSSLLAGASTSLTLTAQFVLSYAGSSATNVAIVGGYTSTTDATGPPAIDSNPANNTATVTVPVGTLASIGNLVFYDNNGNGIQDGGSETGVPNVKVTLYQNSTVSGGSPTLVASTTTVGTGAYLFTGLQPGSGYYVVFDTTGLKALGYMLTTPNATTNTALDSDAGANGATAPISLSAGENNSTIDAGIKPVFDVGITKSVVSAGPYLPGSSVTYQLTVKNNSPVPIYNVSVSDVLPAGLNFVSGAGFGTSGANSVSAVVSPLLAGASTSLTLTAQVSSTFTGSSLANVAIVGRYTSTTDATGPPAIDSNPVNNTATVSVPVGSLASIGDLVFFDNNGNGIQDGGDETGVSGIKVTLYQNPVGGGSPTLVASTTTTASGSYLFPGLQPGSGYYVVFDTTGLMSVGRMLTTPNATTNTALDSDAGVGGASTPISLSAGEFNSTIDAGIKPLFDVSITKSVVSAGPYLPGSSVTYQLTVKNNSLAPVPVYNVAVRDELPAGISFVSGAGFTVSGNNSVSAIIAGPLNEGASISLTLTAQVSAAFSGSSVTNVAIVGPFTATPNGPPVVDSNPTNNTATVSIPVGTVAAASLGDLVFYDNNGNGIQDGGSETGVAGVKVTLYQNSTVIGGTPTLVASTTTTASGSYLFAGLQPGSGYYVVFDTTGLKALGYMLTSPNATTNTALDSDAGVGGATAPVSLSAGEFNNTIDAGIKPARFDLALVKRVITAGPYYPGTEVRYELTVANQGNVPAYNVAVTDQLPTGLTLLAGGSFTNVTSNIATATIAGPILPGQAASLTVVVQIDPRFTGTSIRNTAEITAADNDTDPTNTPPTDVDSTPNDGIPGQDDQSSVDLPMGQLAWLGDLVFYDNNGNGIQDGGSETGVPGIKVTLYQNPVGGGTPTLVASTTTIFDGSYVFQNLTPGSGYYVVFDTTGLGARGYMLTLPNATTNVTLDSDAGPGGATTPISLTAGEYDNTIDAGIKPLLASLGDFVFLDNDSNGQQGGVGETGVSGITVTLFKDGLTAPVATTTTGADGKYLFTGLTPGIGYYVVFDTTGLRARNLMLTLANQGDDATDSDSDPVTGKTGSYTLAPNQVLLTVDAGLKPLPVCPTNFSLVVSNSTTICSGTSVLLTASTPVIGSQIRWYLTPTDGTPFATVTAGASITVNPLSTTPYYAEAYTAGGCVSPRLPVEVVVTIVPTPIIAGNLKNTCPATTADLTSVVIGNKLDGFTYEWYTSAAKATGTQVTNLTAVGAGQYYLFTKSANGCYSDPALLTVEITDCNCQNVAGVSVGRGVAVCSGDVVPLLAVLSGSATSVTWSSNGTGTFSNPTSLTSTFTPSLADAASGSVVITATTNDPDGQGGVCAAATSSLIVQINQRPDAPVGVACDDTLVCLGSSTKLIGFSQGAKINWYDRNNVLIGTTVSGGKLVVKPSVAGAVVYSAEAVSTDGCLSPRVSVTVTVGTCAADLAVLKKVVTQGPYAVGQKVTYSITASNNGPITGADVKVTDLLPSTLTFVSATPAGEYSAGTGVWTIGTLTSGSNRSLLIEATINGSGTVKNLATITGSNNDPNYPQNDTSSVSIPVGQCVVKAPTLDCAITQICKGGSTTLTAGGCLDGTIKWSNNQSGVSIIVSPSITTTYTASCVVGQCVSSPSNPILVTVTDVPTPVILASSDKVCAGASVTLTASGCVGGVIEWSDRAQSGTSITVSPYSKTTYTAQCRIGSCLSNPAVKTIDIVSDLPTPTVSCSTSIVCPGETVTLTVNNCVGTPVWSSTTQTTGSIVVTPTAGNNSYSVYCTNGSCTSKPSQLYVITIVAPAIPTVTASADTVCARGLVSLTATGCNGTVYWNTPDKLTGPVITVRPDASISYYAQCKFRSCLSDPSNAVAITVASPSAPIISVDKTIVCSGDQIVLTAEGCQGTVKWYGVSQTGASITVVAGSTTEYYATCKVGQCESETSNKVRVTVNTTTGPAPVVTASSTTLCSGGVVSLTATGCAGTVMWNVPGLTGSVVSTTVTPTNNEFFAVCKTGASCGSAKSNVIKVNVTSSPTPTVTCSTSVICPGETVTLTVQCQGTPYWSTGETGKLSIVASPTATTSYSVYCQEGVCKSEVSKLYTISVVPVAAPTITASATAVDAGGTVTLIATGCVGDVIWSANGINGSNKGDTLIVRPEGTQTFYAQCKYRSCLSDPSTTITINPGNCTAKAGTLVPVSATVCADSSKSLVIAATAGGGLVQPAGYAVAYVLTSGPGKVILQTGITPKFTVPSVAGNYTIHTLVFDANPADKDYLDLALIKPNLTTASGVLRLIADKKVCADLDTAGAKITVKRVEPPKLTASPGLTVCYGQPVTLNALGCEGGVVNWTDGSVGQSITKTAYSDFWVMATCTINGCTSGLSQSIDIRMSTPGIPTIVTDRPLVCAGETVTLTASGCTGGTYIWSDGKTVGNKLIVTPTADVTYRVKCKVGECEGDWSPISTIKVGTPPAPTVFLNGVATTTSATVCFGAPITLTAQGCPSNAYVTWSNDQVGNSITISLATSVTYTARCCTSGNCKSVPSNPVAITVLPKLVSPATIDRTNTCPFNTVDLASGVTSTVGTTGGVFEYYTNASLSTDSKVANPAAVGNGTYYVVEKTVNGCYTLPGIIHVQINTCGEQTPCDATNPATASAGADASICAAKTYQLSGVIGGAGKTAHWTSTGSGTFNDPYAANAIYTASAEDVMAGKVTLTLSVSTNNASCPVAKDDMTLTIEGSKSIPTVKVIGATSLCYGDSVTLQAPAGATGYSWSNNAKTQSIVVKNTGTYSVQLFDAKGCSSVKSADVAVKVSDPGSVPLAANLRNICPAVVVNLSSALSATTTGSTYEYHSGPLASSPIVMRPDSVGAGTFYVFEKTNIGCMSSPAKIDVKIFNCAADSLTTDLSVTKTASKSVVKQGETVTYTIKVKNNGNHTATNIDVRDVLPEGIELVGSSVVGFTVSNGVIVKRIDSLQAGKSDSISFVAHIQTKGSVVNKALITYCDVRDMNPVNDISGVTVRVDSVARTSAVGLAKSVIGIPKVQGDSLINVTYGFVVTNFGTDTLRKVQVTDDLAYAFSPNKIVSATVATGGSVLKVNPAFTGSGATSGMFDSTSYLLPGRSETFTLNVVVKRNAGDSTKTYRNIASVTAHNSLTTVTDLSTAGGDTDPDGDGNPNNNTGFTDFTLGAQQPQGPSIGLALAAIKLVRQPDSSYNITYKATIKNVGDVPLYGLTLVDSLVKAFAPPVSYGMVGAPKVGAGSNLVANVNFDGNSQPNLLSKASHLQASEQDTVLFTINVRLNGNKGPFFSSATVTGRTADSTQTVTDISNNGIDPTPTGAVSTPVRFDLPASLLGVAKSVGTPTLVESGIYDVPYTISVSNMGSVPLKKVQVVDNLSETFKYGALIVSNRIALTADAGLKADTLYTGQGLITKMLVDSLSDLPVGAVRKLSFVVRVDVRNADSLTFYNTAMATAVTPDSQTVADMSTSGTNDDPDNDLDPRNNSSPTPISLNAASTNSFIGLAMSVRDTIRQADGSFNVTYRIVVKNYGPEILKNVLVSDTLSKVFNSQTGATFTVVKAPITTSTGSALKLNTAFNGTTDVRIVLGDSTSSLAVGKVDTIQFVLNIASNGSTATFLNSAYGQARTLTGIVSDVSTTGLVPDVNGNNNPTDLNEREATPLTLPVTTSALFIPQGFSPNGDGINDLFVIRGMGNLTVSLEVFNRWGHVVYKNDNYKNDWDGKPNTGLQISSDASGLPDGTYYYVVNTSDGRKFVRYMTINR